MKQKTALALSVIASFLVVLATAAACIFGVCFDAKYYKSEYSKLNTAAVVGVSEGELFSATDKLLGYLNNAEPSLEMTLDGSGEQYYTEREKLHMADVKALYQAAVGVMWTLFAAAAAIFLLLAFKLKKQCIKPLSRGFFWGAVAAFGVFALIGVAAAIDFNTFWVGFHRLFFTNDLWILDPAVSRMIRMFELAFFADLIAKILAIFFSITGVLTVVCGIAYQRIKKNERH